MSTSQPIPVRGRFAPSPSGRMHLGNLCCALLAWLSVRSQNGEMLLRIEDLDPDRCTREKAELLMDDRVTERTAFRSTGNFSPIAII